MPTDSSRLRHSRVQESQTAFQGRHVMGYRVQLHYRFWLVLLLSVLPRIAAAQVTTSVFEPNLPPPPVVSLTGSLYCPPSGCPTRTGPSNFKTLISFEPSAGVRKIVPLSDGTF